jgi:hypothetical protein
VNPAGRNCREGRHDACRFHPERAHGSACGCACHWPDEAMDRLLSDVYASAVDNVVRPRQARIEDLLS